MANQAGVTSVWARYGTRYDPKLWAVLVSVTHWTPEDVARESELKTKFSHVTPTHVVDSFSQLLVVARLEK